MMPHNADAALTYQHLMALKMPMRLGTELPKLRSTRKLPTSNAPSIRRTVFASLQRCAHGAHPAQEKVAPSASSKQRSRRQPSSTLQISALWNASLWDSLAPWNLSAERTVTYHPRTSEQRMYHKQSWYLLQSTLLRLMLQRACKDHLQGSGRCCK